MDDSGAAAAGDFFRSMITMLVTGFGAFPGVHSNPTLTLLQMLDRRRPRFARLGITLELHTLPVAYARLAPHLARLIAETKPNAILHFGLAGRRKCITIEYAARNRANILHPDADGASPHSLSLQKDTPDRLPARMPIIQIVSAWRQNTIAGTTSRDAGDYLCNACLYQSLSHRSLARADIESIGFIHVPYPRVRRPAGSRADKRPSLSHLITAAEIAVIEAARSVRRAQNTMASVRTQTMPPTVLLQRAN
jgi:pyroglutamyl-peptidase